MKRLPTERLQNIAFTVTVTLIALALYLLAGSGSLPASCGQSAAEQLSAPTAAPSALPDTDTPKAVPEPTPAAGPGASETDFLAAVRADANVRAFSEADRSMRLYEGDGSEVYADMLYSVREGRLTGWTLRMAYPEKPVVTNQDSLIETALLNTYMLLLPRRNAALKHLIPLLTSACCAGERVPSVVALEWYDGALAAAADGKRCSTGYGGCSFTAYISVEGVDRTLVCTFLFD